MQLVDDALRPAGVDGGSESTAGVTTWITALATFEYRDADRARRPTARTR